MGRPLVGCRVLLVDDEPLIAMDLAEQLEVAGAVVIGPASTVDGALELASTSRFEMAILDIMLGEQVVFPVADFLSQRGVPFVFATGYYAESVPERHASAPVCAKPFDAGEVLRSLRYLTDGDAPHDQAFNS